MTRGIPKTAPLQPAPEESAPRAESAPAKPSFNEQILALCDDPAKFAEMAQLILKDRGGRLGMGAAEADLEAVCNEHRPGRPKGRGALGM